MSRLATKRFVENFKHAIREKLEKRRLEKWWQSTKKLAKDQIQSINFPVARQAWKNAGWINNSGSDGITLYAGVSALNGPNFSRNTLWN
jgi:hypothetical protein